MSKVVDGPPSLSRSSTTFGYISVEVDGGSNRGYALIGVPDQALPAGDNFADQGSSYFGCIGFCFSVCSRNRARQRVLRKSMNRFLARQMNCDTDYIQRLKLSE